MLKFSTYINAWIFSILLLVVPVTKTEKYIINTIDSSTYHYYYNHCGHQYCESLTNFNYILLNFTHVLQDFINILLNGTCVYDSISLTNSFETNNSKDAINNLKELQKLSEDKLKDFPIYTERIIIPSSLKNAINYVNNTFTFNNVLPRSIKENNKSKKNRVHYTWKRRTLCTVSDNEKYSTENLFEGNTFSGSNEKETGVKKTLLDYDGSDFMHDADLDSLKTHVRVKRDKLESDYIKDLANSFPQNNYDSIDENSYDEDVSFDTKREIKSDEFLVNDEQSNASPDENDQQKILNVQPFMVPAYFSDDTSARSDIISAPSDVSKANTFANKNVRFVDQTEKQGMSLQELKNDVISNRRSYENSEVQNLPEDPMLAVELVRKKRNDYAKVHGKRNLEKKTSSDIQNLIDSKGKSHDKEKRSILESQKSESHLIPSSLVAANLKAHLLRIRRKTKSNKRHEKNSKLKKEKKHAGKKHNTSNNSQRSVKDVRSKNTDRSKVSRKRKVHEAKSEGKPKIEIDSVVSKENNDNNFRRRSVKLKKSIKGTDSEIDVSSKNNEPTLHEKLKEVSENKIDDDNSKFSEKKSTQFGSNVNEVKAGSDEDTNLFVTQDEEQGVFINDEQPIPSLDDIKLRAKRDKNTQSHHGFLNKEEELRYYENVREPGSEMDQYDNPDENQPSVGNVVEGSRAVRSIEEVKQLAQKLVSKVNELQNYLDIEESSGDKKREKQIETRAIDDLCANVSTGCDVFKEAPKIVQKCVPTANNEFGSKAKIVERKVDPSGVIDERKFAKIANKNSVEKKRSVVRRVAKTSPNTSKGIPRQSERKSRLKWGKWTDWSSCSVTCGKGRQIRWRYCLRDCTTAETEMEEKACQLPACPPGKFLGIF